MKKTILALVLCAPAIASAWCLPGYTEAKDVCTGLTYCLASGQHAPTTCSDPSNTNTNSNTSNNQNFNNNTNQQGQAQGQAQGQSQSSSNSNTNVAAGGQGGQGGKGGTGVGIGVGGDSSSSSQGVGIGGNSSATSSSGSSTASGGQGGSAQGGAGGSSNATGGSVKDAGNSAVKNAGNNTGNGGGAKVVVEGDKVEAQARNPVNTAFSATQLVVQTDSCRTGFGVGGQGVTFGFTMSGTARDENCEVLKLNRELVILGFRDVAIELLKGDERVKAAFDRVESKDKRDARNRDKVGYVESHETYQATTLVNEGHGIGLQLPVLNRAE